MEDYRLEQSGQQVQDILNGAAMQVDLTSEVERATEAEDILDGKIDAEEERAKVAEKANADDIDAIEEKIPSGASSSNKLATANDVNDEAQARSDADQTINDKIDTIEAKIPTGASSENKLATEQYVDDSVATNTATFRGTYNLVSDLGLLPLATHDQIAYALGGEIATADNNDYCFVQIPTSSETPTQITKIERYKFNGDAWAFEYDLNNSGFTAAQWAAINSGITIGDVTKLAALPTSAELTTLLNGKQDTLTFDNAPTENSNNPVKSGGVYSGIKAEETRAKAAEKANADDIDAIEEKIPSGATSSNKLATASDVTGEATTRENADAALQQAIEAILLLIPSAATSLNQLADKAFVNSSIATSTATFRGTFNSVSDLHLSISATHEQIGTMLASSIVTADNNDYAFVQIPTSAHRPTEIARTERYKFNGTTWEYEYDLNNSGYTTAQWAAINSTITQELVTKLSALPNNDDLTTALSVLTDSISAINAKIPSAASSENKLVDTTAMQTYIAQLLDVLDATYNVTSTDGHVTVQITQTNGKVTAFAVTTSDIASAADLELIAGRVTTAEGNISTNTEDIAQLQAAYAALTQNDVVIIQPTDTWPVANPAENIIYRVVDRVNTPPEYYSDYMWNGTTMVLMAQYNNAIDPRPKKGSTNLVESGGVFDNMGALDVSELNATENPHTLATYADLSAALAAIPSDYQKGGMSIKFVQSSDNKYVQYRLMSDTFNTTVSNWQGIDDTLTALSKNLVINRAVEDEISKIYDLNGSLVIRNSLSGTKQDGYIFNYSTKQYDHHGNGVCVITITSGFTVGEHYLFVGQNLSVSNYKAVYFLDSSDNILEYYYDAENITHNFIHLLTVPENTAKIIINGYQGNAEMASFDIDKNYNLKMAKDQLDNNVFKLAGSGLYNNSGFNEAGDYNIFYCNPISVIAGNIISIKSDKGFHLAFYSSEVDFTSQTCVFYRKIASGYSDFTTVVPSGAKVLIVTVGENQNIRVTNTNRVIDNECLLPVVQLPSRDVGLEYSFNSESDTVRNTNSNTLPFAPVIFDAGKYIYSPDSDYKLLGYINDGVGKKDIFITINTKSTVRKLTIFKWPYSGSETYDNYDLTFTEMPESSFLLYKTSYDNTTNSIIVSGIDESGNKIRAVATVAGSTEALTNYLRGLCNNCFKCGGFVINGSNFISYGVYDTLGEGWGNYKAIIDVDDEPTALSDKLIKSGGVEREISQLYDFQGNLIIRNSLVGVKQSGYIFNYSTKQYDNHGSVVEVLTITSGFTVGQRYLFIGQNFSMNEYKVVYFLDESDNIIEYYSDAENLHSSFIHLLTVPEDTEKIIINGYQGNAEMASFDIDKNYNLEMAKEQLNSNVFKIAGSGIYTEAGYDQLTSYQVFYGEPIEVIEGNSLFIQSNDSFHITYYSSKSEFTSQTAIKHIAVASGSDNYVGTVPAGAKVAIICISSNKEIRVTNTNKIINNDCLIPVTQLPERDAGLEYSFNSKYDTVKNTENVGASPFAPVIFDEGKYIFASNNDYKLLGYINRGIGIEDVFITINTNTNTKRLTLFAWSYNGSLTYENYSLTFSEEPSSGFFLYKTEYDSTNNNIIVTGIDTTGTKIRAIAHVAGANETQTKYLQGLCKNCIKCSGFVAYTGNGFISYGVYDTLGTGWFKYRDNNVAKWYGKKGVTFGDSLTDQGYYVSALRTNFAMTIENCGVSGTMYTRRSDNNPNKQPIYTQIANSITTNPDFVFIMGGTNDYSDQQEIGTYTDVTDSTVCGGCYLAFTAIRQKWPLVPVFVGLVPVRDTSSVYPALPAGIDGRDANHTLQKYNDAIEMMAKRFGFNIIDSMECGIGPGNMGTYYQDGLHFNTAGGIRFAQFIVDKMDVITPY